LPEENMMLRKVMVSDTDETRQIREGAQHVQGIQAVSITDAKADPSRAASLIPLHTAMIEGIGEAASGRCSGRVGQNTPQNYMVLILFIPGEDTETLQNREGAQHAQDDHLISTSDIRRKSEPGKCRPGDSRPHH
jgi:hypothetical protein